MEGQREVVQFEPNAPVEVSLAFATGKMVSSPRGQRVMFSLVDGRVMFLDLGPAQKINALGVKAREPFFVARYKRGKEEDWQAWLAPEAEKRRALADAQANGDGWTAKKLEKSIEEGRTVKDVIGALPVMNGGGQAGRESCDTRRPADPMQPWALFLLCQVRQMTDVYALALIHAREQHGDAVKPADVLQLVLAAFAKGSKRAPADVA